MEGMKGMEAMGWDGMGWDGMGWDGMGWDGMGWDGDGMGWDGMGWAAPGLRASRAGQGRAGQGRAGRVLQRTPPASSCHNHPRKQQTTSQLGCPSHLSHAVTGFREPMRSDAAVVGSFRPISIRVAPATAVDRCSQCARGRGHAASKTQQERAKYLADPPSSLSPPPYSQCCNSEWPTRPRPGWGLSFCPFLINNSSKQRSVASSVWRAW
ncbi:uncharacterized protein K444DRAFT_437227 [Hyaloscypha bicolor E]|uniref:Uncharacterized protein n=1 Tax=Hyaloscypha bicolor E TaxID=1095630 RepID=A0A2J6T541_9HELO|nr:uncharacterized protein K444DRAFT_437227 [Hyaloscypha bicolor E]PMD58135.1 hypothetical protein K444DRAFT_437227 [Hyaloscypha bicolor E]